MCPHYIITSALSINKEKVLSTVKSVSTDVIDAPLNVRAVKQPVIYTLINIWKVKKCTIIQFFANLKTNLKDIFIGYFGIPHIALCLSPPLNAA